MKTIQIGNFILTEKYDFRPFVDGKIRKEEGYWLSRLDGEGMGVSAEKFEKLIIDFYEKEF